MFPSANSRPSRAADTLTADETDGTRATARRWSRYQALSFLLLMATLPLQWQVLAGSGIGELKWFHLAAALFGVTVISAGLVRLTWRLLWSRCRPFIAPALYWFGAISMAAIFGKGSEAAVSRQLIYASVGLIVAIYFAFILQNVRHRAWRYLWLAGPVAVTVFVIVFEFDARAVGVNTVEVIYSAVSAGDPGLIQTHLFRSVFVRSNLDNELVAFAANLRHEIFTSLILAGGVSVLSAAIAPPRRWRRWCIWVALAAIVALVVLSTSRAAIVILLLGMSPLVLRAVINRASSLSTTVGVIAGLFAAAMLAAAGTLTFVWSRFTEQTVSYAGRSDSLSRSVDLILESPVFGPSSVETGSAHNFLLDSWILGGVVAGIAAVVMLTALGVSLFRMGWSIVTCRRLDWVALALFGMGCIPFVRFLTAGGGALHLSGWMALGLYGGALTALRRHSGEKDRLAFRSREGLGQYRLDAPSRAATLYGSQGLDGRG